MFLCLSFRENITISNFYLVKSFVCVYFCPSKRQPMAATEKKKIKKNLRIWWFTPKTWQQPRIDPSLSSPSTEELLDGAIKLVRKELKAMRTRHQATIGGGNTDQTVLAKAKLMYPARQDERHLGWRISESPPHHTTHNHCRAGRAPALEPFAHFLCSNYGAAGQGASSRSVHYSLIMRHVSLFHLSLSFSLFPSHSGFYLSLSLPPSLSLAQALCFQVWGANI